MSPVRRDHVIALACSAVLIAAAVVVEASRDKDAPASLTSTPSSTAPPATAAPTTTRVPVVPMAIAAGPSAPVVSRVDTTDRVVFLTIDDGLVRDPAVVDFLRSRRVPVTIFPNPPFVGQDPAYFTAIRDLGASVQNHTVNHKQLTTLSSGEQQREICNAQTAIEARFGVRPWMLRPPGGASNASVQYTARSGCGVRAVVLWRATMNDGRLDVQSGGGTLQPGDIVLLHFRADLRHNLEAVLEIAERASLTPARLEEYLPPA